MGEGGTVMKIHLPDNEKHLLGTRQCKTSLSCNEKPLTTDQACWYLNERYFYEKFEYGNLMLILPFYEKFEYGNLMLMLSNTTQIAVSIARVKAVYRCICASKAVL